MQEEINLRETLNIVWNSKLIIISVSLIALIGTFTFLSLFKKDLYVATSSVTINRISDEIEGKSDISLLTFYEQLNNDFIFENMREELQLDKKKYSMQNLAKIVASWVDPNGSVMRFRIIGDSPKEVASIANYLSLEISSLALLNFKNYLFEIDDRIKSIQSQIDQANQQLSVTPEKILTQKSLLDHPYLQGVATEQFEINNKNSGALQFASEEINPLYTSLKNTIATFSIQLSKDKTNRENLSEKIGKIENLVNEAKIQLSNNQGAITITGELNPILLTPAVEPNVPLSSNRVLISLGTAIGVFLAMLFIVVVKESWKGRFIEKTNPDLP